MCTYSWTQFGHKRNNMITRTIIQSTSFLAVFSAQDLNKTLQVMRQDISEFCKQGQGHVILFFKYMYINMYIHVHIHRVQFLD